MQLYNLEQARPEVAAGVCGVAVLNEVCVLMSDAANLISTASTYRISFELPSKVWT